MEMISINAIGMIIDDSNDRIIEIRNDVFKLLGINTANEKIIEFIKESLENFSFNNVEYNFFKQIKNIIIEEINKNYLKIKSNESIDYEQFINILTEKLRNVQAVGIIIDDDLKQLANQIVNRFPEVNITRDQFYSHFIGKREQIVSMINQHNQNIIDTLVKLTPQLAEELKKQHNKNSNSISDTVDKQTIPQNDKLDNREMINNDLSVNNFISRCSEKLNEINLMFLNGGNSKSEIAKCFRQLQSFMQSLNDKTFAQGVLDKYEKINVYVQTMIYDEIIFQNVPELKEMYEKYKGLLENKNIKKTELPKNPTAPTPSTSTYVGKNIEEIKELIRQKKYYSILQGISAEDVPRYANFINNGFEIILNDFLERANKCKTYEERHIAYFELYEIYQNFRDYISLESSNQLREQLDSMNNYLQQRLKTNEEAGIRYNTSKSEENISSMRR